MTQQSDNVIDRWHDMMAHGTTEGLYDLLAPDCVFWSPVVHTPQQGRDITHLYLSAAGQIFDTDFRYVREVRDGDSAVLEFEHKLREALEDGIISSEEAEEIEELRERMGLSKTQADELVHHLIESKRSGT